MEPKTQAEGVNTQQTLGDVSSNQVRADLIEGTRIHRYIILGLIGKGGMGAVYKAYDPELDRRIAIKILTLEPQVGENASVPQARLMREAQALARLNHPNIVSVFDVGTYQGGVYIAMEYVKGKTIRDWMQSDQPPLRQILNVFWAAGTGLQAAHAQGIIHRDFKPDNVLVGEGGQVKVLDFGLARAAGFEERPTAIKQQDQASDSQSLDQVLSQPLTRVGARVGTPVYMAPEQFLMEELDEKTDQFSFCVSLFEALVGKRPFRGKSLEDLAYNVTMGEFQIPMDKALPAWIRALLEKGLASYKSDRYASMEELLADLLRDPEAEQATRRKKQWLAFVILMAAFLPLFVYHTLLGPSTLCKGANDKLERVYNAQGAAVIKKSFLATKVSYASDTVGRVIHILTDYTHRWKTAYIEACEATHVKGEQSYDVLDLRMSCLTHQLAEFAALTEVLAAADEKVVSKAVQAANGLSDLSDCGNTELLKAKASTGFVDAKTKQAIQQLENKFFKVEAWRKAGHYEKALATGKSVFAEAVRLQHAPLVAEAHLVLGRTLVSLGRYQEAKTELAKAYQQADGAGDDLRALRAANQLLFSVGYRLSDHKMGEHWYWLATIKQNRLRLGANHLEIAHSWHNRGNLQLSQGHLDQALQAFQKALGIREKLFPKDDLKLASSYNNMGIVYWKQGQYAKALQAYTKTLSIETKALGPQHPEVGSTLNNMGIVYRYQGLYQQALEVYTKALQVRENALGQDHPDVGVTYNNIGLVYYNLGKFNQAVNAYQKAIAIREKSLGPKHPSLAISLNNIGKIYRQQKRYQEGLDALQTALSIFKNALPTGHPKIAVVRQNLGELRMKQGNYAQAGLLFVEALAIREQAFGKNHASVAGVLAELGELALLQNNRVAARGHFNRMREICRTQPCDPEFHCKSLFSLARILNQNQTNKAQAWQLGQQAEQVCKKMPLLSGIRHEVVKWLQRVGAQGPTVRQDGH